MTGGGEEERSKGEDDEEKRMRVEEEGRTGISRICIAKNLPSRDGRFLAMQILEIPVVAP